MRAVIVGCGRVGEKRARALDGSAQLVAVADSDAARAETLAARHPGCAVATDWRALVARDDYELAIVCTPHDRLAEIATAAVARGRHVLVEKPAARSVEELDGLIGAARRTGTSFWGLIRAFAALTGVPVLLNTSFNENEPIVDTPEQALDCFLRTQMERVVLGDWVVERLSPRSTWS